jgi:glycosyltransferase involved in cell wall biosynthesis
VSSTDRLDVNTPLVSVLLPTHNRPHWLAGAIRSVVDGAFKDFELIVSNNGDPQHTRKLAEEIQDPRIRWIEYDRSSDILEHVLSLFDRASGKYVAMLHDDDWWDSTYLAKLVPALEERDDAVLGFVDHHQVDAAGIVDKKAADRLTARFGRADLAPGYHKPFFDIAARQSAALAGSLIRRDALDLPSLPAEVGYVFDLWLVYTLAKTGGAAYFQKERLLYLRVHDSSATSGRFLATYSGAILCRRQMLQDPRMAAYAGEIRGKLARDHISAGAALLRQRARSEARAHLLRSLRLRPQAKAVGGLIASWVAPDAALSRI